ncbi:MAG: PIN domain-containing protein [Candidatus Promineifilaceae bacterium]|nr:PIN domain-containing protein [Candidatus Promineifilaceae bacterium]
MIVVDASVWVCHLLAQDNHHRASRRWFSGVINRREIIAAPGLLLVEVSGAIARRTGNSALARRAYESIAAAPGLRLVPIEPQLALLAARLAADLELRGPDAIYVAVAHKLRIPLVTWDREQLNRASRLIKTHFPS